MGVFALLLLLTGCPGWEPVCKEGGDVILDDLVHILPFQATYNHGDVITIKVSIPSVNNFFGSHTVDIFDATEDHFGQISFGSFDTLLQGNSINIVTGIQGDYPNIFKMPYNPSTDSYELELQVTLNRVGSYSFPTGNSERIDFKGAGDCNFYIIGTSFQGAVNQKIEFEVL